MEIPLVSFSLTTIYATLQAADLDWIVGCDNCDRIEFRRIHFGVFSTSRLVPLALSSDWT